MRRTINKIQCKLCNETFSSVGLYTHLKSKHQISNEEYTERFGEFRVNKLKKKMVDDETCLLCTDGKLYNTKGLTWHIKNIHGIDKLEYVKGHVLGGNIPNCKCGCGQSITVKSYKPYIVGEYIAGHNSKGESNPRYGANVSTSTRRKMQLKAQERIKQYQSTGITLPMHKEEAIAARASQQRQQFIDRVEKEYNVTILDRIKTNEVVEFTVKCNACDNIFTQYHNSYFTCWMCNHRHRSVKEQELIQLLSEFNIPYVTNNRKILSGNRELDIVFLDHKLAIEFDGLYWHSELQGKDRAYHLQKTQEAEEQGYHLLHIFEDEWEHHREIIIGKIQMLLKIDSRTTIYARNTTIRELSYVEAKDFLDAHHLQGADHAKHRYGLFHDDMLISVMTFSKPNSSKGNIRNVKNGTYELSRYCSHSAYRCIGGASKLLKHFIKVMSPAVIISYADRRYSKAGASVYDALGFTLIGISSPNYWYFNTKELRRYHRFNFTKRKTIALGGAAHITEWENMVNLGYNRIWDCGHLKYQLTVK
jgi:very-short-patch-repair endonuclease